MQVEAIVPAVGKEAAVFGIGLEQEPEEDPRAEPVGVAQVVRPLAPRQPVQRFRYADGEAGNDALVHALPETIAEVGGELPRSGEQVGDGALRRERGGGEDEVQVPGVLRGERGEVELEPGVDRASAADPRSRLRGVEANLIASEQDEPLRATLRGPVQAVGGRRHVETPAPGFEGLRSFEKDGDGSLFAVLAQEYESLIEPVADPEAEAADQVHAAPVEQRARAAPRRGPAFLAR